MWWHWVFLFVDQLSNLVGSSRNDNNYDRPRAESGICASEATKKTVLDQQYNIMHQIVIGKAIHNTKNVSYIL